MSAISIRLDDEISKRLSELASKTGRTKTFYIREALQSHLEDLEDTYLLDVAMKNLVNGNDQILSSEEF